jgi:hypothetical protein
MEVKQKKPRLNFRQRKLLRLVCDGTRTPEELLEECGIPTELFARWLNQKPFWSRLRHVMRAQRRRRKFDVAVGANLGARSLAHQTKHSPDPHVRRLCGVNEVSLDMQQEEGESKRFAKRKATIASSQQEFPTDLDPAEAERLFRELEKGAQASGLGPIDETA